MKFGKNGNLIPQKVRYKIKHNELDEEIIENYVENECNFQIKYNKEGEPRIIKENENEK